MGIPDNVSLIKTQALSFVYHTFYHILQDGSAMPSHHRQWTIPHISGSQARYIYHTQAFNEHFITNSFCVVDAHDNFRIKH